MLSAVILALALAQAPSGLPLPPASPVPAGSAMPGAQATPAGSATSAAQPSAMPAASPLPAAQPLRAGSAATADQPDLAVIVNSGSTNTAGYALRVRETGWTTLERSGATVQRKRVAKPLVARFFADLRAAGPLAALPRALCMKSVSFGSVTTISYRGATSPDFSCPSSSSAARALGLDIGALRDAVGIAPLAPRRMMLP